MNAPRPAGPAIVEPPNGSDREPSPRAAVRHKGPLTRFLIPDRPEGDAHPEHATYPWYSVLWLTGVDYFSTLGYQPGIAFLAAGALSPLSTLVLVVVTLFGALPVYSQVARRSYAGQGSIAMLERLIPGWLGKLFVLVLLGFAATDFVITMTLSAADAAQHAVENPLLHSALGGHKLLFTCALLTVLAVVFLRGFREAIGVATFVGVPYILLNIVVLVRAIVEVASRPDLLDGWTRALSTKGDATGLLFASVLIFPKLALGMSGFETGVSVTPLIRGEPSDGAPPAERIRSTQKLLLTAALLMSVLLVTSSVVTTVLIPAHEFETSGKASGRALSYLAHGLLGGAFGTLYDLSTIVVLWFAGASAMAGMLNLIPRYLPRFGMAPRWVEHARPLVLILLFTDLAVTLAFKADVEAQGGAYATGVLVLMLSAAVAVSLALWRESSEGRKLKSLYFWGVAFVLGFTLFDNVLERPDGIIIAGVFILAIVSLSGLSRFRRATELRVDALVFADDASRALWEGMRGKKINLVPVRSGDATSREKKLSRLKRYSRTEGRNALLHVELADDTSEFVSRLRVRVTQDGETAVIAVTGAVAIANTIAWVSEQLDPVAIYLELSLENPVTQALSYLVWGEGEVGILVYEILVRHWHRTPEDDVRPLIYLVSR
jgi:hypothetical protein